MSVANLTPFRRQILKFIEEYVAEHGNVPTVRRIGAEFEKSSTTIHYHLRRLEAGGWIRMPRQHRLELVPRGENQVELDQLNRGNALLKAQLLRYNKSSV